MNLARAASSASRRAADGFGPSVTVVVPTYRRPDMLQRCLEALCGQTLAAGSYEIIVADDGPDEATREVVEEMAARSRSQISWLPVTRTQGPAGARNAGWRAARGKVIAFTDDDTQPAPQWLEEGMAAIAAGADAISGRVEVPLPAAPTDHERDTGGLAQAEFVTANCFIRRDVLDAIGGFDERYTRAWREDSDLHFALLQGGYRIGRARRAVVVHPVRPAPWGVSMPAQAKVFFDALLYRKYPRLYRQRIRPVPPIHYYLSMLCLLVVPLATIVEASTTMWLAIAGWAALTAHFAWLRLRGAAHTPSHVAEMIVTSIFIPPLSMYWRLRGALHFRVLFL